MDCLICKNLDQIDGFGGYMHYKSTKELLDKNVENNYFNIVGENPYETKYRCNTCNTVWTIAAPDFPVRGYLLRK